MGRAPRLYLQRTKKLKVMIAELQIKCLEIENWTRSLTLRGVDKEEIVAKIDEMYEPESLDEMEAYSEAIAYARLGVLN
jgi:hypothetical protein